MKIVWTLILALLVFMAISSGIAKVAKMDQEVAFFGKYGFSKPALVAFGLVQIIAGLLLPFGKTRFVGAALLAVTMLVSLVILILDGNTPVSIVTVVATVLLGAVALRHRNQARA